MEKHWGRWEQCYLENNVDLYLQTWNDPIPIIQVFGERHCNGKIAPLHNAIKYRTVEDALRAVGQAHLGGDDPRKDHHGGINFSIQRQIKSYAKTDYPPRRVKPVPIINIVYIFHLAYDESR
jgi:hypothetical protein